MPRLLFTLILSLFVSLPQLSLAQKKKNEEKENAETQDTLSLEKTSLSGLKFRSIGPAVTGGRIVDIDVNPEDPREYYVASGHGSLWKTENGGVTFSPVFEKQGSVGAVALAPSNPHLVWLGSGENNAQSNVLPGDGVYKSEDGGKSWTNKGLKESQQIGAIVIHPQNPDVVWVAAYGGHRTSGGERGVYKTTDGGETWEQSLAISEHTGCWELHMDPRDPDVLYAVSHQRRRYLFTIITGGEESGIHKTTDGGKTWNKLKGGLPQDPVGRIGMAISPANPDVLYAVVDAKDQTGLYRSDNRGASWSKQSGYNTAYPFYMQKLFCDPHEVDRLYAMDLVIKVSDDGGKNFSTLGETNKHVDNHTLWIDPQDTRHLLSGCDGGVYETFDRGKNWDFKSNLPISEIYKVTVDNAKPFYNVYVGTQDNHSLGAPSRTLKSSGITNADWLFTRSGDGFETQVDWQDPNIVYSQAQFGALVRFDKNTGERLNIQAYEIGDTAYRFDWDAPLLVSRHDHKRLYHGANLVLRSDDQGNSWREISPDLTRGVPQEMMRVMDRSWSMDDMVLKSPLAQLATLAESPLDENILFAGSADGLIHYTWDGGQSWEKGDVTGLPEYTRIHHIIASQHDKMVAYAACHNQFAGDYQPYLYKTRDGGKTWASINANLPERGCTYTIGEDHANPNLLFVGTMFGVYVSNTSEPNWVKLKGGMPTVTVMDLDIHRGENDLVVSTFGRGVYILDDYSPLREITPEFMEQEAAIFPISDALMFIESNPLGYPGVGFQGASFFSAPNPEVGTVITFYVKEKPKSLEDQRREAEKKLQKEGKDVKYPDYETLKKESEEEKPFLLFTITDEEGNMVRKIKKGISPGVQRLVWNFRYSGVDPISLRSSSGNMPWQQDDEAYMVTPGTYQVELSKYEGGAFTQLVAPQSFECRPLNLSSLPAPDQDALSAFNRKVASLARAVSAANAHRRHLNEQVTYLEKAVWETPGSPANWLASINQIKQELKSLDEALNGDDLRAKYEGSSPTSLRQRVNRITGNLWNTTSGQTATFERAYDEAADRFGEVLDSLKDIDGKIAALEAELEKAGAPYTPGRVPEWEKPEE